MPQKNHKNEKWALITGASSGIGAATAIRLGKLGYNLILTGRRKAHLEKVAEQSGAAKVEIVTFDISKPTQIEQFLTQYSSKLSKLEILINNAGLAKGTDKVFQANIKDWEIMIDTNIKGLFYLTHGILPFFLAKNSGHIVNMGSVAGRWVYPGGAIYCATKFAVRAFSEGLRQDLIGKNIRVTNIEPGMVNTEFSLVRLGSTEKADAVYSGMQPLSAEDIAETIAWVIDRPKHVNVQELVIYPTDQAHVNLVHRK